MEVDLYAPIIIETHKSMIMEPHNRDVHTHCHSIEAEQREAYLGRNLLKPLTRPEVCWHFGAHMAHQMGVGKTLMYTLLKDMMVNLHGQVAHLVRKPDGSMGMEYDPKTYGMFLDTCKVLNMVTAGCQQPSQGGKQGSKQKAASSQLPGVIIPAAREGSFEFLPAHDPQFLGKFL